MKSFFCHSFCDRRNDAINYTCTKYIQKRTVKSLSFRMHTHTIQIIAPLFCVYFVDFHPILNFDWSRSSLRVSHSPFYVYTPHASQQTKWSSLLSNETLLKIVSDDVQTMHDSHWQVFTRFSLSYSLPISLSLYLFSPLDTASHVHHINVCILFHY